MASRCETEGRRDGAKLGWLPLCRSDSGRSARRQVRTLERGVGSGWAWQVGAAVHVAAAAQVRALDQLQVFAGGQPVSGAAVSPGRLRYLGPPGAAQEDRVAGNSVVCRAGYRVRACVGRYPGEDFGAHPGEVDQVDQGRGRAVELGEFRQACSQGGAHTRGPVVGHHGQGGVGQQGADLVGRRAQDHSDRTAACLLQGPQGAADERFAVEVGQGLRAAEPAARSGRQQQTGDRLSHGHGPGRRPPGPPRSCAPSASSGGTRSRSTDSAVVRLACVDRFTAATTLPLRSWIGAATERSPSSSSWSTIAQPCSRSPWPVRRGARSGAVTVRSVSGRSFATTKYASSSARLRPASRTCPIEVAYAGKRVPTLMLTVMMRETATRAT